MKNYFFVFAITAFLFLGCGSDGDTVGLPNPVPLAQDCESTNPLVGGSRSLRISSLYNISGTVNIVSDCEIQFTNFFYNGRGPAVSIYGGNNGDFVNGFALSEPIQGRVFNGETLSVFLPEGTTLDEINSFSVWCFEFDIDFSSVNFAQ